MNKATKGTLAIAAGVVLLFGGGGSLAYWSSQATVTPAQVTTGQLTIGTASSSGWSVEKYLGSSFTSVDTASYLAVPGDTLQYAAIFPVTAVGTNLAVSAALTGGALTSSSSGLQTLLGATPTYTVKDQSGTTITPSAGSYAIPDGTTSLSVTTTISWPFGSTGDQVGVDSTISLSQIGLTLTQVAP